jgi:hypothetical protein
MTNFNLAEWGKFYAKVEVLIADFPPPVLRGGREMV